MTEDLPGANERFEVYSFGANYTLDCVIEFNPKSNHEQGDVVFKYQRGFKVFLSWGPLKKVEKLGGVEGQADFSIKRIKGAREAQVTDSRRERLRVMGHPATYNELKVNVWRRGLLNRSVNVEVVRSLHVHCDISSRYFILYGPAPLEKSEDQGATFDLMTKSLACHVPAGANPAQVNRL